MPVLVLMYHDTPRGAPDDIFGVRFSVFQDQITTLIDSGASFIPFCEAHTPARLASGRHVAVTFDDGNGSNAAAVEWLHGKGIRSSLFIVTDWARSQIGENGKPGYLSPSALRALSGICAIGGHGSTHVALPSLSDPELAAEMANSALFVEEVCGHRPAEMSFPGGALDRRASSAARAAGFAHLGNSVFDINQGAGDTINRVVVRASDDARGPLTLYRRSLAEWRARAAYRRVRGWLG